MPINRVGLILLCAIALMSFMVLPEAVANHSDSEQLLVNQFYPQALINDSNKLTGSGGPMPTRNSAYADADFDGTGKNNYIVAAYSNGVYGAVLVLKKLGASATVIAAPSFPLMLGLDPSVTMLDVDGDGIPEAIVNFSSVDGEGSADWVLKWNGTTLQSIGPTSTDENGNISPTVIDGAYVDLTGNGKLDIISSPDDYNNTESPIYSLVNGHYESAETLEFSKFYRRESGTPTENSDEFSVTNPGGQYVMTIANGSGTDKLVSSAKVVLNGVTVASQRKFNQNTKVIKVPVTLQQSNVIGVTLYGAPSSELTVVIGTADNQ